MFRALVIIPTYNERESLAAIVTRVLAADDRVEVLVVDDNSPDGTGLIADRLADRDPRVAVLHRPGKLGLGTAYIDGFGIALRREYDAAFEFDADGSHPPERLPAMLDALEEGADLVIGTRWMPGGRTENWPFRRILLSRGASIYARVLLRSSLRDITAGYRGYRADVLRSLDLEAIRSNGYCFQIETAWMVERVGYRVVEVPITFTERTEGASKMSGAIVIEAVWRVAAWGIGSRLRDLHGLVPDRVGGPTPIAESRP